MGKHPADQAAAPDRSIPEIGAAQKYTKGMPVWAFYSMSRRSEDEQYLACADAHAGIHRPRVGLSEGWIPAQVDRDFDPAKPDPEGRVRVRHLWKHFYNRHGAAADIGGDWLGEDRLPGSHIVPRTGGPDRLVRDTPAPELGIIAVRWGGRPFISSRQWGSTGNSASDTYFGAFLRHGVIETLQLDGKYEVWTAYVEDITDLQKLAGSAHLIFGHTHPVRRCRHVRAAFLLYHTAFDPNIFPTFETAANEAAAYVERQPYTQMIQAFERIGIRTAYPHYSHLYDTLAGKSWQHSLCLDPGLRIPAGLAVARADIESDLPRTVETCLTGLEVVRRTQRRRGLTPVGMEGEKGEYAVDRGVVKLRYSWEAQDVKHWQGPEGLQDALYSLSRHVEIQGKLIGQPHDCDHLILQEYVPHDCELRLYYVEASCELILGTKMQRITDTNNFTDFAYHTLGETKYLYFNGDEEVLARALRQCRELSEQWLDWLLVENGGKLPPAIRFDILVRTLESGAVDIRILEVCEIGFNWLEDETIPPKVFAAIARSCIDQGVSVAPHQIESPADSTAWANADQHLVDSRRPAIRPTLRTATFDDGTIAYDPATGVVHHLNAAAASMLALCDGRLELQQIGALLNDITEAKGIAFDEQAVASWLVEAIEKRLVVFGQRAASGLVGMDADELGQAARRLRQGGRASIAFQCQRRATELAPDRADFWSGLGELAGVLGDRDAACSAYRRYLELRPKDATISRLLDALEGGPPATPAHRALLEAISSLCVHDGAKLDVLDLGCGTGLGGEAFKPWSGWLEGVDSSAEMATSARERGVYDAVHVAELAPWLADVQRRYDLVALCDVLTRFEDFASLLQAASRVLSPPGWLGLTVERSVGDAWTLTDTNRYAHSEDYVRTAAAAAGLHVAHLAERVIRTANDQPVVGLITVLRLSDP